MRGYAKANKMMGWHNPMGMNRGGKNNTQSSSGPFASAIFGRNFVSFLSKRMWLFGSGIVCEILENC
jgi:hypothetical protein